MATTGVREAIAAFKALPEITRENVFIAREITAKEIVRNARARVIASPSVQTGALRDHIGMSASKRTGRVLAGIIKGAVTIGGKTKRPTRYAHLVEFGSVKMPAEPFMIPSAEAERNAYVQRVKAAGPGIERNMAAIGLRHL